MTKKILSVVVGLVGLICLYFGVDTFRKVGDAASLYAETGNIIPVEFGFAKYIWFVVSIPMMVWAVKLFKSK